MPQGRAFPQSFRGMASRISVKPQGEDANPYAQMAQTGMTGIFAPKHQASLSLGKRPESKLSHSGGDGVMGRYEMGRLDTSSV